MIATRDFKEAKYLVFATKKGVVKKTEFLEYNTPLKADGIIALKMREDDELVGVRLSDGNDDILMVSRMGQAIRFHEKDVRPMGRPASGVAGMKLRGDDEVIEVDIAADDADLLVVTENGWGKRTRVSDYPVKGRGTMGVKTAQLVEGKGRLAGARIVREGYQVMLISDGGTVIRMAVDGIKRSGPRDAGRDRDAAPRGRARLDPRSGDRTEDDEWRSNSPSVDLSDAPAAEASRRAEADRAEIARRPADDTGRTRSRTRSAGGGHGPAPGEPGTRRRAPAETTTPLSVRTTRRPCRRAPSSKSIGIGKTIVELFVAPISSSVCR